MMVKAYMICKCSQIVSTLSTSRKTTIKSKYGLKQKTLSSKCDKLQNKCQKFIKE